MYQPVPAAGSGTQVAAPPAPTREKSDLLEMLADHFKSKSKADFNTLQPVDGVRFEHMDPTLRGRLPTARTVVGEAEEALARTGIFGGGTMGGFMDATGFTVDDLHAIACRCLTDTPTITGAEVAKRLLVLYDDLNPPGCIGG